MHIVVFVTASSREEAQRIAQGLVKNKLAACVNIVGGVESLFWWQGKVDRAKEILLVIKSKKEKLSRIIKQVKSMHSYDVPEIIALSVAGGYKDYLKWINESVG